MKLEDYTLGRENSLRTAYESLRKYDQLVTELTGQNVDDLLKNLQGLNPRALEAYFQSLREGRGEIEQLSQTQLAHIDLIEQLVVTYRALAVESDAARDAAAEYADHLRPVDVIFETLTVHARELTSQFVEQREALQRHTQATEAQAQAARDVAAATTAQAVATERANTGEVARTQHLLRTTQHTRKATEQVSDATERLTELTGALVTTDAGLATHSEHVGYVTEAYRELSEQIGATVGDVLAGAGSFREAWEFIGRGALDVVKDFGRGLMEAVLGNVKALVRRLSHTILIHLRGILGSFGSGGGLLTPLAGGLGFVSGAFAPMPLGSGGVFGGTPPVFPPTAPTGSGGPIWTPEMILTAAGVYGGSLGGDAALRALGLQPGLGSKAGSVVGGIAGSMLIPIPVVGPLVGSFFGSLLGGAIEDIFGPTQIVAEKTGIKRYVEDVADRLDLPGDLDLPRKQKHVLNHLPTGLTRFGDLDAAATAAGFLFSQASGGGFGTAKRFRNQTLAAVGRRESYGEPEVQKLLFGATIGVGGRTPEAFLRNFRRAQTEGLDGRRFNVHNVLQDVRESGSAINKPVLRYTTVLGGIIDLSTEFDKAVDGTTLAAQIAAGEIEDALRRQGRSIDDYTDVIEGVRNGTAHVAEALRDIGNLDFHNLLLTEEEFRTLLDRIKDLTEATDSAARNAITQGISQGQSRAEVEVNFKTGLETDIRNRFVKRILDDVLDPEEMFEGIDFTEPFDASSEAAQMLATRVGAAYDNVLELLRTAGLLPDSFDAAIDAADKIGQSVHRIAEHNRDLAQTQQLEAVGVLDPGTSQQRNLNFLQSEVATLDALTNDTPAREIRHAMTLLDQLAAATVEYYRTALAQEQQRAAAFAAAGDSLDQQIQSLIGGPGGYRPTERLAFLQDREREIRTKLKDATGVERATYLQQLGTNLTAQAQLPIYSPGDPRHIARRDAAIAELESLRREADSLRAQSEEKLLDLQEATKSELERIHALQDAYFAASLGKLDALVGNTARDYSPPTDLQRIVQEPHLPDGSTTDFPGRSTPPDGDNAAASSRSLSDSADRPAPAVTINVTLPESPESSDAAVAYARAFVAELERQLQPGARGYELVHSITRESGAR